MTDKEIIEFLKEIKDRDRGYYIVRNVDEENFITYRIERWDFTRRKGDVLEGFYNDYRLAEFIWKDILKLFIKERNEVDYGRF